MMEIALWVLFGLAVGVASRFVMPPSSRGHVVMLPALGIGGAVAGAGLGRVLGFYRPGQSASFIMAVIGAVIVLTVYDFAASRR